MARRLKRGLKRPGRALCSHLGSSQLGLTTLEYVIGAGIILVVLAGGILAWNQGLVQKIGELISQLLS
jgi:hypothetical protein